MSTTDSIIQSESHNVNSNDSSELRLPDSLQNNVDILNCSSEISSSHNNVDISNHPSEILSKKKKSPCNDPKNLVCRQFVNQGNCRSRKRCQFYHPKIITPIIKRKASRKLGYCFCGAQLMCVMNKKRYRIDDDDIPKFFVLCSKTRRSMKLCL